LELSKEKLVKFWADVARRAGLKVHTGEKVEAITSDPHGGFAVQTNRGCYRAVHVVLALGRRGSPRKLGIAGEERSKVMYSLIDAEAYRDARILVVGGGDSAVEAALGLAAQRGNHVTLSYRQPAFSRIKERNSQRIQAAIKGKKVEVLFSSRPIEIRAHSVCLETNGSVREIPNDWVWVFAGGDSPNAFLAKIGVAMGSRDLTDEAAQVAQAEGLAAGHAGPKIIYPGA
jgi:thioredoxin reductase